MALYSELGDPMAEGEVPLSVSLLESVPPVWATTGWNVSRVSNTILGGGSSDRLGRSIFGRGQSYAYGSGVGTGNGLLQGIGQTLSPRNVRRLRRPANIDPTAYGSDSRMYTPFGVLARTGNFIGRNADRIPGVGQMVASQAARMSGGAEGPLFSPGSLGRIRAMHRMGNMSIGSFARSQVHIRAAMNDINPAMGGRFLGRIGQYGSSGFANPLGMRYAYMGGVGSTMTGTVSGRLAGRYAGASAMHAGTDAIGGLLNGLDEASPFARGVTEGLAGKTPWMRHAGGATTALSRASWIMLAHDLAEGAGKLISAGVRTGMDALISAKGSLDKPVMGMGFRDNTVAATSRQRGVMAIANSRLNMRSFLGSEGAAMHAHFG